MAQGQDLPEVLLQREEAEGERCMVCLPVCVFCWEGSRVLGEVVSYLGMQSFSY